MNYYKIFFLAIMVSVSFFSCKDKQKKPSTSKNTTFDFKYKTFVEVVRRDGEFVIFDPCDGPTRKLKWNLNDELEILEVVEDITKKISKSERFKDGFRIYYGDNEYYDFRLFNKEKSIFKVSCKRNDNYANKEWGVPPYVIDSELSKNFRLIKQPCLECYTEEQCIALGEISVKKKSKGSYKISNYLTYKKAKIVMMNKEIEFSIPFIEEHIDFKGDTVWRKDEMSSKLEVKLLRSEKGNLYFVFGEGKCGACPSFSALYDKNGKNLSYRYSVRMNAREAKTLISKGDDDKILSDYGLSEKDVNIQINDPNTPIYLIKNWYN